ncbi:MAG TPA: DUF6328 family protein [Thermoanaerobaculia bacterium]|nr:DUF6328 family protein [Thermoanaerobaculia bacterium]
MDPERREELSLPEAITHLLEECRMVLPGIQALFGFQLIAVFNTGFAEKLNISEQRLHLVALGLVAIAVALLMAPAAYHRQTGPRQVTERFITVAGRLLLAAMVPLMVSIGLEFYLIARVILSNALISLILALALMCVFSGLWFLLPRMASHKNPGRSRQEPWSQR